MTPESCAATDRPRGSRRAPRRYCRAAMVPAGCTLRRSELFALRWSDVNFFTLEISVTRSCVRGRFDECKTEASRKPVPLHSAVSAALIEWRKKSPYDADGDFLFPSLRLNGKVPLSPDMVLRKIIRPALVRAEVTARGSAGTASGTVSQRTSARWESTSKVAQKLLRHANSRITMDLYTRAVSADKRLDGGRQMDMLLAGKNGGAELPYRCVPSGN